MDVLDPILFRSNPLDLSLSLIAETNFIVCKALGVFPWPALLADLQGVVVDQMLHLATLNASWLTTGTLGSFI